MNTTAPILIVGLGNPGPQYEKTRHNAGFMAIEHLSRQWHITGKQEKKFDAIVGKGPLDLPNGKKATLILAQPLTFMNLSGKAVQALMHFYKIPVENLIVIVDDLALPLGKLRFRPHGSEGGHNGLKSIRQSLGSHQYARLRLGIGTPATLKPEKPAPGSPFQSGAHQVGYVLGAFSSDEMSLMEKILTATEHCLTTWLTEGADAAMTQFNGLDVNAR